MKRNAFPVSLALLWSMVFAQAMHSVTLGICMGLLMGIAFGLFKAGLLSYQKPSAKTTSMTARI